MTEQRHAINSTIVDSRHRILADTSIAALSTSTGDRHIFFQDCSGTVRQAIFVTSKAQWLSSLAMIVATDAKNHTPIAALVGLSDDVRLI